MTSASTETVYPLNPGTNPLQLTGIIQQVIQSEINGRLNLVTQTGQQWDLYFQLGRIVWASGGEHRFRRWHRVLRQAGISPVSIQMREKEMPAQWEHLVLSVLLKRNRLKREDVQRAIETNITEVLFDVLQASAYITEMGCNISQKNIDDSPVTILGTPDDLMSQARQQLKAWQLGGLGDYSPNFAPVITSHDILKKHCSPQMYVTLVSALTGKSALRDLALIKRQSLTDLALFLRPYVEKNVLALQPIADFPAPVPKSTQGDRRGSSDRRSDDRSASAPPGASQGNDPGSSPSNHQARVVSSVGESAAPAPAPAPAAAAPPDHVMPMNQEPFPDGPLIVCIDDSPQVGYIMEQVLVPLGYQVLSIQDPIQALSTLMRRKPDFIFLDLIMPVINGYELCGQIRRVSALKQTPIAILTGNDGVVDRVRAKMVGANDFLGKPVVPEKVMAVLQKHVRYQPAPMAASRAVA